MMRIYSSPAKMVNHSVWALVLVLVAIAALATGRWVVPAGSTSTVQTNEVEQAPFVSVPNDAGHVIGMTFEPAAALPEVDAGLAAAPDSRGEGHVIGMTFESPKVDARVPADPDSAGEGHVIGMTFR